MCKTEWLVLRIFAPQAITYPFVLCPRFVGKCAKLIDWLADTLRSQDNIHV